MKKTLLIPLTAGILGAGAVLHESSIRETYETSCETYQGFRARERRFIFDPKIIEKRSDPPEVSLLGDPEMEDSLEIGKKYIMLVGVTGRSGLVNYEEIMISTTPCEE